MREPTAYCNLLYYGGIGLLYYYLDQVASVKMIVMSVPPILDRILTISNCYSVPMLSE